MADLTFQFSDTSPALIWAFSSRLLRCGDGVAAACIGCPDRAYTHAAAQGLLGKAFGDILVSERYSPYGWVETARRQVGWAHLG